MALLGRENVFSLLQTGFSESLNTIAARGGFHPVLKTLLTEVGSLKYRWKQTQGILRT